MELAAGDLVGEKYRIVRVIGDGGMGTVYEARHEVLGASVAIKVLQQELATRPGLSARFLQEARVSATLESPHVARVTDFGTTHGSPYLVMELLQGESLQTVLDRRGKLPPDEVVDFGLQILSGLETAHALGVVHRDLKPDNVFVTHPSGGPVLKLIDFGIAKLRESKEYKRGLTTAGSVLGTAEYMAPEQFYSASEVDHRADVYSLGVLLFQMLSGSLPASADDVQAIIGRVLSGDVQHLDAVEPGLDPKLVAVVERALRPDREQRFASAFDMRQALAPLAGKLSHAGRLAAALERVVERSAEGGRREHVEGPERVAAEAAAATRAPDPPQTPAAGSVPDTVEGPPLGAVPKTLPPSGGPPEGGRIMKTSTAIDTPTQAAPPPAVTPADPRPASVVRRRRAPLPLWPFVLGGLLLIVGAGWFLANPPGDQDGPDTLPTLEPTTSAPPPISVVEPVETAPRGTGGSPPVAEPTGRKPPPPRGNNDPPPPAFPSFTIPSTLPPLPPLPSTFPQIPGLPSTFPTIPGLTPPSNVSSGGQPPN